MKHVWRLRHREFYPVLASEQHGVPSRYTLWGIVNITMDSFFDGGIHATVETATEHALSLFQSGARILDLGGASTRPGSSTVAATEEIRRVLPVLKRLTTYRTRQKECSMLLSVDTWQASVAVAALENGADIINDVSGGAWDPGLVTVLAHYSPGYVLTHCPEGFTPGTMQNAPAYGNVILCICRYFEKKLNMLIKNGFPENHVVLDPGIGFGKNTSENFSILANMHEFLQFGRPIMVGLSNKSLFGGLLGLDVHNRAEATSICTALLASHGIFHHRVHDVCRAKNAIILAERCSMREEDPCSR